MLNRTRESIVGVWLERSNHEKVFCLMPTGQYFCPVGKLKCAMTALLWTSDLSVL